MKWISTTPDRFWQEKDITTKGNEIVSSQEDKITLTGATAQTVKGFGGCFNELGAIALEKTDEAHREEIFKSLFSPEGDSCKFRFCRMPIGASDYAASWYSHDEYDDDYEMAHFSIDHDKKYLIPYIREAMKYQPELTLFASPWSPPTWMKYPKAYNFGRIRMEDAVLKAYALYFQKFVDAYREEGINIEQIHVQNEVFADQKFPSCLWSSEQLRIFIRDYLGPLFEKEHVDAKIWLGTLNGPEDCAFRFTGMKLDNYNRYVDNILFDKDARKYISGIGYQWAGRDVIARTHESWPEIPLMQTENECGDGRNTWEYAEYVFGLMHRYFHNGVTAYTYWNMVLEPGGASTWGWNQNAMITIEPDTGNVIYNPEFYALKHFSAFVQPGAVRLETAGHWNSVTTVFKNPDGSIAVIVQNALDRPMDFSFEGEGKCFNAVLEKNSMNTFLI